MNAKEMTLEKGPDVFESMTPSVVAWLDRHSALEPLITREVMAQTADGQELAAEAIDGAWAAIGERLGVKERDEITEKLMQIGQDIEVVLWKQLLPRKLEQYALENYGSKAESRFMKRKTQLDRVTYSLIRVQGRDLAQELLLRVKENEAQFSEVAEAFSEGPERKSKGLVGPVPITQAHPVLAEVLRTSRKGEIRGPFQIENWNVVVKLEEYIPAVLDNQVRLQLSNELFQEWAAGEAARIVRVLRQRSTAAKFNP